MLRAYHPELPTTGRQLLGTPRSQRDNITEQDEGEYGHISLSESLIYEIMSRTSGPTEELAISLGVDGVSTGKDGRQGSWIIAAQVIAPFVGEINCVGVWSGQGKPTNFNQFMRPTVDELKVFEQDGLEDERFSKRVKVSLKYIIADTPCRASMKYIKTSGYHSCERCTVKGRPWKSTIVFPGVNFPKRDNTTFRQRVHPSHHKVGERSILEELDFDMILGFPQEAMHEIYGGCVQRLLLKWFVKGHLLPSRQRAMICENVKRMTRSITEDFARKNIDLNKVN